MTKEFKTGKANGLFVEVPDNIVKPFVMPSIPDDILFYSTKFGHDASMEVRLKDTGNNNHRFLFTTLTATEEDAKKIVDESGLYWKGYLPADTGSYKSEVVKMLATMATNVDVCFTSAIESLHPLIQSLNLDASKNYAVLIKIKP